MKVSVVMPVRDAGAYLAEAVESVLGQIFADLELVVVDDGSTDRSREIALGYDDPRVVLVEQAGEGLVPALNAGIARARGELVARMDADDVSVPERLERQVAFLDGSPRAVLAGSWFEVIDAGGRPVHTVRTVTRDVDLRRRLFLRNPLAHGTVTVRREAVLAAGGYRAERWPAEDYDLWCRLARHGELAVLPEVLYRWRRSPRGSTAVRFGTQLALAREVARSLWDELDFPALSPAEIAAGARHYRALDRDVHAEFLADQYALAALLAGRGRRREALRTLRAALVADPLRVHLALRVPRDRLVAARYARSR